MTSSGEYSTASAPADGIRHALTAYQRDIWTSNELTPGAPSYVTAIAAHLVGDLDTDVLTQCIARVWRRNDGLRLQFGMCDGVPYQMLAQEMPPVEFRDVSAAEDPATAARDLVRATVATPIDLAAGVPLRISMVREGVTSLRVLLLSHHVAMDATGLFNFAANWLAEYASATTTGSPAALPATSFIDCLESEHAYRGSAQWTRDRDSLIDHIRAATPVLFDRQGAGADRPTMRQHHAWLDRSLVNRLRERNVLFFPYLCAIAGTYLTRVLRTDEVTIGVPLTNRTTPAEKALVGGHFANVLPLRVDLGAQRSLADVVADLRSGIVKRIVRQRFSLGDLIGELRRSGSPSGPFFDVTVNYLRLPGVGELPDFVDGVEDLSQGSALLALAINVYELDHDGPLRMVLNYATDVFGTDYPIESVESHLKALLSAGIDALDGEPGALPMLSADELDVLTDRCRATAVPFSDRSTLIERVMAQAARTPYAVAMIGAGAEPVTYDQFAERIMRLANLLRRHGVGVGDRVAVRLERGPDMVVAILAALHAGAAYVPIDPSHPAERVRYLLEDSAAKVVLIDGAAAPVMAGVATMAAGSWTTGALLVDAPAPAATDAAYVIYTSGSTGHPKGVVVEHRSVINRLAWMQRAYPIGADDVILQKTPISFDVSVWELFWWAIEGAKVALLAPGAEKDPREILHAIAESRVTVLHFVPSMLTPFLDQLEAAPEAVDLAESLRVVFCSGEPLRPNQVMRWNRAFARRGPTAPRLVNLYGPTEATVDVSSFDCPTDPDRPLRRVPIGRPIDNTRLYVLGTTGQPQPTGVTGELCIAGVGVARGYLNRPDLQAEKFVSDPFHDGDRMYRTGDLARWLADGQLEYLGRLDRQVKIRGNRVELAEVENALVSAPGVTDAMVVDTEKSDRGTLLVAYYVASAPLASAELRKHLSQTLPDFMVPVSFYRVDEIPLTASGKADRATLEAGHRAMTDAPWCPPRTDVESVLAGVWRDVLDVGTVSVHDNFFDLGGDSILTLRVRALAEARGLTLTARDIAAHPTVAELAGRVALGADTPDVSMPIEPFELVAGIDRPRLGHLEDAYPLTLLQLGMVFHSSERLNSPIYHDVFRYSLRMPWNETAFRTALDRLVARHPALRTAFDLGGFSEPLQLVYPRIETPVDIVDLRAAPPDDAQSLIDAHVSRHRCRPYQLDRPGLYHFGVFLAADRVDLVFAFHHAILDGWSVATIVSELLLEYRQFDAGPVPPLDESATPSFSEYVRAELLSIADPADREYWAQVLAGAPPVRIPGTRAHAMHHDPAPTARVQRTMNVSAPLVAEVERLARAEHVPVKAVFLTAHLLTVGLFAGHFDITSGVVTHGRPERAHTDRTAGLFLNTMPIRIDTAGRCWRDVLHAVFDQDRASAPHQRFPLFEIQRRLDIALDVAFNYANFHTAAAALRSLDVELLGVDVREDTNFTLLVNVLRNPLDGTATLRIDGDPTLYTPDQLDQIGDTYLALLRRITTTPTEPVTYTGHPPSLEPPDDRHTPTVIDLFRDVVTRHRDATALQFHSRTVTYGELDETAWRIAAGLLARGARPGDRIAVAMDRSPELIATVLGIAMAGTACVPLDVTYPKARLASMLDQAGPTAVIVDSANESLIGQPGLRVGLADLLTSAPPPACTLPVVEPQHAAYVLFTSGSTGTPKGVVMPHRALANLIQWQLSVPSGWLAEAGRAPSTLQFAPLAFDVAFQEIYSTLCGGGRLILVTAQERRELPTLLRTLDDAQAERVILPYVALQALADIVVRRASVPSHLRIIASSGEQLRITDEIRQLCAAIGGVVLENQYGPTETHVVTYFTMTGDAREFPALPPIGNPINNVEVLVLDRQGVPVPDGAPGEICIAGIALADGYHDRPDLTDEVFETHAPGVRLYRTGDVGRRLPDGALVTDGRRGNQVKVRGHRVEPMDVELALRQAAAPHAGITDVAVIARASSDGSSSSTQLVAFLVGDADEHTEGVIRSTLRDLLPDYMIPTHLEWLDALPRTASGKRADQELVTVPLRTRRARHVAPRDEHEAIIAELVADVLGVPNVGVFDEFSSLGGDSLSAVRLVVAIEQRYGLSVPVSILGAGPAVAALADRVRGRVAVQFDPCVPIKPTGSRSPLFLVHPIGGNVLCYVELSKYLPPEQPLYGLQAEGMEPGSTALQSISEMARRYVEAIRRIQPHGPYHIGGWSLGGVIAFEMARQLEAQCLEVGSVLLLDSAALGGGVAAELPVEVLYESFMWELLSARRGADAPVEHLPDDLGSAEEALDFIHGRAVEHRVLPRTGSKEMVRRLFEVFRGGMLAVERYRPQACDCAVTLLRAADPLPEVVRPAHNHVGSLYGTETNGWDRYVTGTLTVIETPGNHLTMVEKPYASALAAHLGILLAETQPKPSVG